MGSLEIVPLTPDRWEDFTTLFGKNGACAGCWCMYPRLPKKEVDAGKGEGNRLAMRALVKKGPAPGLLAYDGAIPVGWCALAPREEYRRLERSRVLAPVDDKPTWTVTCFFIARSHRKQGVSLALLRAAVDHARSQGAPRLEGHPVDPSGGKTADTFAWTGLASTFLRAGFREVARRSPTRPIMRRELRPARGGGR